MSQHHYTISDAKGQSIPVAVQRDKRLKKSARWQNKNGVIVLRVPYRATQADLARMLGQIEQQLARQSKTATRRTDADLQARAKYLNRKHFRGQISWSAIRWVETMEKRLGSCTNGGPTDGHIRISERIRTWPQYVIDYVIAHELAHRIHPDHSQAFWDFLTAAYPLTEKARGFVEGVGFARGETLEEDAD